MVTEGQWCWDSNTWNQLNCMQTNDWYKYQYLKPFNRVQTNIQYSIELLVFDTNTWNHLTIYKQMINIQYNY